MKILIISLIILFPLICFAEDYNRLQHFGGWYDLDYDGQNTREEVLEEESLIRVEKDKHGKIIYGIWYCEYTGLFFDDPKKLDIDHRIPLKECWLSGGELWNQNKRIRYANYLKDKDHLLVVRAKENREKGAKDITEWLPLFHQIDYIFKWVKIKEQWNLCFDKKESDMLEKYGFKITNICE